MTKHLAPAAVAVCALLLPPAPGADEGVIRVESSTISDRFDDKRQEPGSVAAIGGRQLERERPEHIQQLLQSIPGITTEVQSGDSVKIHIRGVENQSFMGENPGVAVVIDGVPVFERTGRVNIDLDNIESIRVVKGGASWLYGDDALAGAVIITTKRGADRAGYRVAAESGAFGHRKGLVSAGFAGDAANGHLQLSHRSSDGYHHEAESRADYLNGKFQYYLGDAADLTFGMELGEREKDSHGAVRGVTAAAEDPRSTDPEYNDYARAFDVRLQKYFVTYAHDVSDATNLTLNAYQFSDDTRFISRPDGDDPHIYTLGNDYQQVQRGAKAEWRHAGRRSGWMLGGEVRDNQYDNRSTALTAFRTSQPYAAGDPYADNETDEEVSALYAEWKVRPLRPLTLTLNGRHDVIDLDYRDRLNPEESGERRFEVTSWRVGGNLALSATADLFASAATGFRTPTVQQLFTGRYSPVGNTEPNAGLEPEKSLNREIGWRQKLRWGGTPMELDLSLFQLDREGYINSTAGQYSGGPDARYENVGDVRNRGLELSLSARPSARWWWDVAYTWLDARYTRYPNFNLVAAYAEGCAEGAETVDAGFPPAPAYCVESHDLAGNRVPRTSRHQLNLRTHYKPAPRWTVMNEVHALSPYYADEMNRVPINGHGLWNLLASYDRRVLGAEWSWFLRVDNVLDRRYYNTARGFGDQNGDGLFDEEDLSIVVNPGRTWMAGFSAAF